MSENELWVKSIYGNKHRKPFVELHYQDTSIQMGPDKARELALMLLESAEAAEQDAFLFEWAKTAIKATDDGAAQLILEFRKWREGNRERIQLENET